MDNESIFDEWIANRRAVEPSCELTDRVMVAIERRGAPSVRNVRLADRMNNSLLARCAACLAALVVGSLPLLYVAHAAKLLVF
ncbi:MAG: hypothetical protein KDA92_00135 [Planctomycetales bacterium]|nr:hypothetical protein [Planctomycetales bacterium]MCA9166034.1 hypothetical protein [Planctomycetales bacterium]